MDAKSPIAIFPMNLGAVLDPRDGLLSSRATCEGARTCQKSFARKPRIQSQSWERDGKQEI